MQAGCFKSHLVPEKKYSQNNLLLVLGTHWVLSTAKCFFEIERIYQAYPILLLDFDLFLNANQLSVSCREKKKSWSGAPKQGEEDFSVTEVIKSDVLLPYFIHELDLCLVT